MLDSDMQQYFPGRHYKRSTPFSTCILSGNNEKLYCFANDQLSYHESEVMILNLGILASNHTFISPCLSYKGDASAIILEMK